MRACSLFSSLLLLLGFQFQTWLSIWGLSPFRCQVIHIPHSTPAPSTALSQSLFPVPEGWRERRCNEISVRSASFPANGLNSFFDWALLASYLPAPFLTGVAKEGASCWFVSHEEEELALWGLFFGHKNAQRHFNMSLWSTLLWDLPALEEEEEQLPSSSGFRPLQHPRCITIHFEPGEGGEWGRMSTSSLSWDQAILQPMVCNAWKEIMEGAAYQLASCIILLGYMGGSGIFGSLYIFGLLAPGYFCYALWGWLSACGLDIFIWNMLLVLICLLQLAHLAYRLRRDTIPQEFDLLYKTMYLPLQVPLEVYKEIVKCCEERVQSLVRDQNYAVEGKTPIDRLSLLLSGR